MCDLCEKDYKLTGAKITLECGKYKLVTSVKPKYCPECGRELAGPTARAQDAKAMEK